MPLHVINDSNMKFAWMAGRVPPRVLSGTFIAKATLQIKPGETAALLPLDNQLDPDGEKTLQDDPEAGPTYPGDFALFKPRGDVVLTGSAHAAGGKPVTRMVVTLRVGQWSKSLFVFGDRVWVLGKLSEPRPFTSMPLTWERAFGGKSFKPNPHGRGIEPVTLAGGELIAYGPNVEDPRDLVRSASDRPVPASFGPLGSSWPQRVRNLGTYNGNWLRERWPWLPDDFDWSYFNAAPQDQRVDGFLRGDETIVLEGMNAAAPRIDTALPALKPRWFMRQIIKGRPVFGEIPLVLDTLFIDAEKLRIVLLWRGVVSIQSLKMKEVTDHLIVTEQLGEGDKGLAYFEALLDRRNQEMATEGDESEPDVEDSPFPLPDVPPLDMSWAAALDAEIGKDVAQAEDVMASMKSFWAEQGEDLSAYTGPLVFGAEQPFSFADVEAGVETVLGFVRDEGPQGAALADQQWLDANLKADMEEMDKLGESFQARGQSAEEAESEPWSRERVIAHYQTGNPFADQELEGLDLAGVDLRAADFRGAVLSKANFTGALLDEANLDGAVLEGAIITDASFRAASLKGADLTQAQGERVTFADAVLDDATFVGACLSGASLENARGEHCDFSGADLARADVRGAVLEHCDFSQAKLEKLRAAGATLVSCDIGQALAAGADFTRATVTDIRATGATLAQAVLRDVVGTETAWDECILIGADFTGADLPEALFDSADLTGAVFDLANLPSARFCDANLSDARFLSANLFRATLENSILARADFRGANMYEVEFYQAGLAGVLFEGANLKGTKLA